MGPLYGAMLKVLRVREQLDLLKSDFSGFLADESYALGQKHDDETGEDVLFIDAGNREPPLMWSVRIGEMLYDLRSALDHMVWQLVIHDGGTPGEHTEFPIFFERHKYLSTTRGGGLYKLTGVGTKGLAFISALQPYHARDDAKVLHPLGVLHQLSNIDKHRFLHLSCAFFKISGKLKFTPFGNAGVSRFDITDAQRIHGYTEVARLTVFGDRGSKMEVNFPHTLEIAFDDAPAVKGRFVREVLSVLIENVNKILVAADRDLFA